jgi:hypothetical protein
MEKYKLNEGNDSLKKILLMMKYNNKKTLSENVGVISEQSNFDYFTEIVKSFMKYPKKFSINVGSPTIDTKKHSEAIYKSINRVGRDKELRTYIIPKTFNTFANSVSVIKTYPSIGGESIYDAIHGEWFSSNVMNDITSRVSKQLQEWCSIEENKKNNICTVKSKEQLKYGI